MSIAARGAFQQFPDGLANSLKSTEYAQLRRVDGLPVCARRCSGCFLKEHCLAAAFLAAVDTQNEDPVNSRTHLNRKDYLIVQGAVPRSLYVIKSGSVKVCFNTERGEEQIVSFGLAGDVIGLDAIGAQIYATSAIALERTSVCTIPLALLNHACRHFPDLYQRLFVVLSDERFHDHRVLEWITRKDTEEKLASFLLNLSDQFKARGFSASHLNLSMSRTDIGSYLGIAVETVSRILTRFQKCGLLSVNRRHVNILDHHGLESIAGYSGAEHKPIGALGLCAVPRKTG